MNEPMKQAIKMTSAVAVLALLGGCATISSTMSSLNPFGGGAVKPAVLQEFTPQLKVANAWSVDVGDSEQGTFAPVLLDSTVYAASEEGQLIAIDKATGKTKWKVKVGAKLKAGVAATLDTVAVIDVNNNLIAFDLDGKQKWQASIGSDVSSVPVGASGTILVRGIDFSVIAYSASNGGQRWKYTRQLPPLTLRVNSPVDVNNARVYAGFPGGRLVALDLNAGTVSWEGALTSPTGTTEIERIADVTGTPVYNFREVCAAAFQGKLGCLDAVSARPIWTVDFSAPSGASVDDRYMIAPNELGDMFAFSRSGGKQVWKIENFQRRLPTTPAVIGRAVAVGDFEGYVHFIERDTGKTIARTKVGSTTFTSQPVPVETDALIVQSRGGSVALISVQ
ncbi:MAG: outer membrane protein assembly factor BamB [Gammaproteobacteria bacterium]|uniref:outer membrane protein assembly factor BamB n=1 Tax=Limnobacter sp. TaxID=2003368 RepID=UPI001D3CF537|nr:outer membrane protein assembly factor BamB [Limnobacter sp.]MBU0783075.1 outer membrane protein assembly factor BamB [Gammaproteobacteria bacterium]MBU0849662.1 outer membrane protein assembly factor BamB [Gammaproteobacteria bacterium]MBU1266113.1 outer membrane protein assembly factor BamB [Gammaproteobacteria bacterium]MBU1529304.1 outer membrane protein assembly factor BamB [Gammaproteobacteria bacterium]MBU1779317.1 outer membrane protein assembly factor BamB [Gammaproteobacteria bact